MTLQIILVTLNWLGVAFFLINIFRQQCVKGTRRRYIYTTVEWTLAPPVLVYYPLDAVFTSDPMFLDAMQMFNLVLSFWVIHVLLRDDDDNWWRRKRKQLKRYLTQLRPQRQLHPVRPDIIKAIWGTEEAA
jgi:hypothetical protein